MKAKILLAVALTLAIAVVAIYAGRPSVKEGKVTDELGEKHEIVIANSYVLIKHGPSAHQRDRDFDKMMAYVEARQKSWERWRKLVEKYGNETYKAYVVPCRLYTVEEFASFAKELGIVENIVEIILYVYYKNGTYHGMGFSAKNGDNFNAWLKSAERGALTSAGHYILFLRWVKENNGTLPPNATPPFGVAEALEVGKSEAEVYIGAFVVEAPLRELYQLSKKPQILIVDLPLDLIWKYREEGYQVIVKRVTFGDVYLIEKKNLCPEGAGRGG
ncbi:hypothetical protein [Pyrobaculum ferrireducens]|uniref:Uncharacterized protein n=1 Tax=Pyrobaculum ferrireducens TaxID=1104324 RepID=G7VD71_9CREN|nr:hypothetical protein [Pyrobaculum ferrireducens]AET33950.1 hypothetical protein P186_2566 [Pyrobaculum ferrireducens]